MQRAEGHTSPKLVKMLGPSSHCPHTTGSFLPHVAPWQGWGPEVDSNMECFTTLEWYDREAAIPHLEGGACWHSSPPHLGRHLGLPTA